MTTSLLLLGEYLMWQAFALLYAAYSPYLELIGTNPLNDCPTDVIGVSTVHGNASLEKVTKNCLRVMRALNKTNIPVHAGQARPLTRQHFSAKQIHGESGLDGTNLLPDLRPEDKPSGKKAVLAMAEGILAQPKGEAMLVATGSMTNLGILVSLFPEIIEWLKGVVIMGGAVAVGNITPVAEFNIWVWISTYQV
jgi:uridine nucleosidase